MEIRPNCSSDCNSGSCFIHAAVNSQQSRDILLKLCTFFTRVVEVQSRSLSPVLCAVTWTLLSCGMILTLLFLIFTIRYKNNRIVKMSSPNLNMMTLLGSALTYTSGFLFAIEDRTPILGTGARAVLQVRIWTLCIGSTLVFGPILGKTWRIYKVFTQRLPDRRVIIKDIQLMGLVALLVMVDVLVLAVWSLTDPVKCSRSVSAVVKVVELDVHYSLSQLDSCSSLYSDLWVLLVCAVKASLLLYGTYLAGLTSNVSLPPVNQSLTIMAAVCLVSASTAVAVPVCRYLYMWPNLVYGVLSGSIFICTTVINCLLFVPQLTEWRQFEDEVNPQPSQMAKYFSSPSKSMRSVYSEDEIYYLLGENDSMKRLISEKDAVIVSLQEQVNNAKDKLLKLMSGSHLQDDIEMDSSATNLNSSSTQITLVPPDPQSSPIPMKDSEISAPENLHPTLYVPSLSYQSLAPSALCEPRTEKPVGARESYIPLSTGIAKESLQSPQVSQLHMLEHAKETMPKLDSSGASVGLESLSVDLPINISINPNKLNHSTLSSPAGSSQLQDLSVSTIESNGPAVITGARQGFVSSKQLQEILHDLSVNAMSSFLKSPAGVRRPLNIANSGSPGSPLQSYYPSISPYMMRKRRPPFSSYRNGPPPYFYPGSEPPGCRRDPVSNLPLTLRTHNEENGGNEDERSGEGPEMCRDAQSRPGRRNSRRRRRKSPSIIQPLSPSPRGECVEETGAPDSYGYSDSETSSSDDFCYYHRPYCEACRHSPYVSSESSSTETDNEYEEQYRSTHPVVNFKEDLKPTFV